MLTTGQFDRIRRLALRVAGIQLFERHRQLLERRGPRIGVIDGRGFDDLLDAVEAGSRSAVARLVGLITTRFTGFFRHPRQFEAAARHALRTARRNGAARFWSAAAATGEEPYSLAMTLVEAFEAPDPPVTILASDINEAALETARRGEYGAAAAQSLSPERRARFFTESADRRWTLAPAVRELVRFHELNLADVEWPIDGPFDGIFCRNVLMYLEAGHRYAALEGMASLLAPAGLLVVDPAEHLGNAAHWFRPMEEGVYSRS